MKMKFSKTVIRAIFVPVIVVKLAFGVYVILTINAYYQQRMEDKGNTINRLGGKIANVYIRAYDFWALGDLVNEILDDKEVVYAVIYNKGGEPLTTDSKKPEKLDPAEIAVFEMDIKHNEIPVGKIEIGISKDAYSEGIKRDLIFFLLFLLAAILLGYVASSQICRAVAKPLGGIVNAMEKASKGDISARFVNEHLPRCWEYRKCGAKECKAYGAQDTQCWGLPGAKGKRPGGSAELHKDDCATCKVYKLSHKDEIYSSGESMNKMLVGIGHIISSTVKTTDGLKEAVEEIMSSSGEIAGGAERQVSLVEEAFLSLSSMSRALMSEAKNVESLASSAEESSSSIMEIAVTNDKMAEEIDTLASSVGQVTVNIKQMTRSIKDVAKSVEDLSATTERTSTSMREMDVSIGQVETNANEATAISEDVRRDAERGSEAMKKTIQGIGRISESTRVANTAMVSLGQKVQAIGQVLNVINDVAGQTILLALNASIIAAKAGEHGKGFAVVAVEIKGLAERTATSTSEISGLIRAVQTETRSVSEAMEGGMQTVDEGVALSAEAEQALTKILESSTKSTQMVREIALATVEQARGSKVVTDAIQRIDETVQQIASATGQQAEGSEQIMITAYQMKDITMHVHGSSQEQSRGSQQVTASTQNILEMVHQVENAQNVQTHGSEQVASAVEMINKLAKQHSGAIGEMRKIIGLIAEQVYKLSEEVSQFKLKDRNSSKAV